MYTAEQQKILENLKLTPKENFLRVLNGEIPESVPLHNMGVTGYNEEATIKLVGPSLFDETHLGPFPNGTVDVWGVKYIATESTGFGCIPEPGSVMLEVDDLINWRKFIKIPKLPENIDWEALARKDWEKAKIDHTQSAAMAVIGVMPFQQLVAFMGFEGALMSFYEEPDAVKEILQCMVDVYLPICQATVQYYTMDCVYLLDDTASAMSPFLSKAMYEEFLKPVYEALTQPFREEGIPIQFHNCGRCEDFLDDMIDFGVKVWDPAQTMNDLKAIKQKYGSKLVLAGCFDWKPPITWPEVEEEYVRELVHNTVDMFAPGGAYMGRASALGVPGDINMERVNKWLEEEMYWYTRGYYNR